MRVPEDTLSTIGRYQILEKVGQGGMGVVYRAHDSLLEREVALKIISASIEGNAELRERFYREARAAGQLSHRNIITIHDLGEHDGQPYLAMEFLNGEDLQRRLSRPEPMSLARKLEIAADICDGLSYAHRRGLIHRDIKPANIFITDEGVVKLLDFGLARMVTSELTASNMMLGTLNYMAPEQVRGERTDHRADIFSFGVVLYEILSGRKAFQGDSFATTLYKILQDVPEPLQNIDASLPYEVVRLVEKSIAKMKEERYQDLSDLARDLALHRQHLALSDSDTMAIPVPTAFRAPSTHRASSDPPRSSGKPRPDSGQRPKSGPRTLDPSSPTILADATTTIAPAGRVTTTRSVWWIGGGAAAVLIGAILTSPLWRDRPAAPAPVAASQEAAPPAAPQQTPPPPSTTPQAAVQALPPPPALAEDNARLLADARARMSAAKASARQRGPAVQRSSAFTAALAAEREGGRLQEAKRTGEAAEKFYEAAGLFRSAELTPGTPPPGRETAAAEPARVEPSRPEPAPSPASQAPAGPAPAAPTAPTPAPPVSPPAEAPVQTPPAAVPGPPIPPLTRNPPAASQPPPATPRATEDEVRDLVRRYEQALESRSIDALKRIWPSLQGAQETAVRQEFMHSRRIDVDIEGVEVSVSGATAIVTFIRRYQLTTTDGQRPLTNSRTTMNARRVGAEWLIERVRFEGLR
jgi:eukaryotic-like serine/threonine-protein kinase